VIALARVRKQVTGPDTASLLHALGLTLCSFLWCCRFAMPQTHTNVPCRPGHRSYGLTCLRSQSCTESAFSLSSQPQITKGEGRVRCCRENLTPRSSECPNGETGLTQPLLLLLGASASRNQRRPTGQLGLDPGSPSSTNCVTLGVLLSLSVLYA
jgi:hypothetical protein